MNYVILIIGIVLLVYDGILAAKGHTTISRWCQALFPTVVDWFVGIGGWILLCLFKRAYPELDFTLAVFIAGFWGHIWISNQERYKEG